MLFFTGKPLAQARAKNHLISEKKTIIQYRQLNIGKVELMQECCPQHLQNIKAIIK